MRSSLSLQRSLYAWQKKQIGRLVQSASPTFRNYERRYHRATARYRRVLELREVVRRLRERDIVYVGDYHTLRLAQQAYLELVATALQSGRRVVLALEFVEGRRQAELDAYLAGRLTEKSFLAQIGHPYQGAFDIWPSFRELLALATTHRLEVVAIDRRATGPRGLDQRDRYAAQRIAAVAAAADRPLVLVLMGQFHIAPSHLPAHVERALKPVRRERLIVYQNAEGLWWQLAKRGLAGEARAVELTDDEVCLFSASPVVCQRSFLDYVEAETGDAPLDERGLKRTFALMARDIGRLTGVRVGEAAGQVAVVTAADLDVMRTIVGRGRFTASEVRHLEQHVLSRESAFIPRGRTVWLASLSLNHAAEEAAHFVRHCAVGDHLLRPRTRSEAFFCRVYEEALGFFGSRLVNPARRCVSLAEWKAFFTQKDSPQHRTAAFVLALNATPFTQARALVPATLELFNSASHAMGYLLGEALAQGFTTGRVSRAQVRALFSTELERPAEALDALRRLIASKDRRLAKASGYSLGAR
jgi:hypothetical protein